MPQPPTRPSGRRRSGSTPRSPRASSTSALPPGASRASPGASTRRPDPRKQPMVDDQTTWLTLTAHRKLVEELEDLTTNGRRAISERIGEARSHGDIREKDRKST